MAEKESHPTQEMLEREAARLETASPQEIIAWAAGVYRPRLALSCSFGGASGMVLLDMAMQLDSTIPVLYTDTGLLFPETYALLAACKQHYGITPRAVRTRLSLARQAERYGDELWTRDPDACCELRKVRPQRAALKGFDAWITGIRRDQARTRRATPVVQWDAVFGLAKINPLATWDERAVWHYILAHKLPYNPLHDRGFPSIGCVPCTRAIQPGEDLRAGRWSGITKVECGLHLAPAGARHTTSERPEV